MDKATIKAFIGWLEEAKDQEIEVKREATLAVLARVSSDEVRADVRLALRLIDEEVMARTEVFRVKHR